MTTSGWESHTVEAVERTGGMLYAQAFGNRIARAVNANPSTAWAAVKNRIDLQEERNELKA